MSRVPESSGSPSVLSGPAAVASPGDVLEIQMIGLHPRSAESKTLGVEPSYLSFTYPLGDSNTH